MLYDPEREAVHILNPTAKLIWETCTGDHTVADIVAAIRRQYAGTEGIDVHTQVQRTLDTFATRGLLQPDTWPQAGVNQASVATG
jgi:hypothetical protein